MSEATNTAAPVETTAPATGAPDAGKPAEAAPPTAAEIRKMKLKIGEQEVELPEDEVVKLAQKGKAADKAFQEGARARKQAEALIAMLKNDPLGALQHEAIGHDVKKIIADYIRTQAEEAKLTPAERKARDLENELKTYKEKEESAKEQERQRLINERAKEIHESWEKEMIEVLQTSGLPRTNFTAERVAYWMEVGIKNGKDVTPKMVVPLVKADIEKAFKDMYGAADDSTLAALLGDEGLAKASREYLKKQKKGPANNLEKPHVSRDAGKSGGQKKVLNEKDWLKTRFTE